MIVAPQDQFYIETNLAICSFTQFAQYAHLKKIAQSCRSGNKAKFAYLPTQNTAPSKNLILNTMTRYPLQTTGLLGGESITPSNIYPFHGMRIFCQIFTPFHGMIMLKY